MAKSNLKKEQNEENRKKFLEKLNTFMLNEGFENFEIAKLELAFDCNIITQKYCEERGLVRKKVTENGESRCYCVLGRKNPINSDQQ